MKNRKTLHPATVFFILWWTVAILSWVGSVYSWNGIENILSAEAMRWFLRYTENRIMQSPVLYGIILLFIGGGLFVHSGLKSVMVKVLKRDRKLSGKEKRSLLVSAVVAVAYAAVFLLLLWGPWNIVRGVTGRFNDSPLHDGAMYILFLGVGLVSIVYAFTADHYRRDTDIVAGMSYMFSRYSSYLISLFFAIQFMTAFGYSGFPKLLCMSDTVFDIVYFACCLLPIFGRRIQM